MKSKKLFESEYGSGLAEEVSEWIRKQTITDDGGCKIYRPFAVVELFDQEGDIIDTQEIPEKITKINNN